jgi:hypothetical protein
MVQGVSWGDYGNAKSFNEELPMTTAKSIEYQITQQLLRRRAGVTEPVDSQVVNRVIRIAAATVAVVLVGSYSQELLWVLVAATTVLALGIRD